MIVAVFDTWPAKLNPFDARARINDHPAVVAVRNGGPGGNQRLADMGMASGGPVVDVWNSIGDHLDGGLKVFPFGSAVQTLEDSYDLSDHGLFVAGIIHDIAPGAEINVYRVLTHEGVGHTDAIARAVQAAIDDAFDRDRRLVLNFSLGMVPNPLLLAEIRKQEKKLEDFYEDTAGLIKVVQNLQSPVQAAEDPDPTPAVSELDPFYVNAESKTFVGLLGVIEQVFQFDQLEGVLAIAAAGNDSSGNYLYTPRLPAAVEGVIAVSAVADDGAGGLRPVDYSNIDNFFAGSDGLSAFGGKVNAGTAATPTSSSADNALLGLFTKLELPPGTPIPTGEESGWARWSGTSFATPIAAGIAACLWSRNPAGQTAAAIARALQEIAPAATGTVLPYRQH